MKKRTNSHQVLEKLPGNSPLNPNPANSTSQNYLHNLKQSLLTKAPKITTATTTKKPETISSLLRAANIRPLSSTRAGTGSQNTHRPSTNAQANPSSEQDNRSCNPRMPKLHEAKSNLFPRNNSEPRLNNHILKHVIINIQEPTKPVDDSARSSHRPEEKLQSPETETHPEKYGSLSGIEFMTTGTSSTDKKQGNTFSSASAVSNLDSQDSTQKLEQIMLKKASRASTIDILYESFENKDYATGSEENDSKFNEVCMNHPNKKAKYYTIYEEDPALQYHLCSKCAVALANKGTKIRKIIASEEELRKSEIEGFLIRLSHSKKNTENITDSMNLKRNDFDLFFSKQIERAETIASVLEKMIKDELHHTKKTLDSQRNQLFEAIDSIERQLNANLKEISDMQSDIERNLENILKNIELKPFQKIIGAYHERVQDLDQQLEAIRVQKIGVEKLPRVQSKQLQELESSIQMLFARTEQKTSILKKNDAENNQNDGSKKKSNHNVSSLCVSFENKDIFEGGYDPIFESHQRPDRFTFANDKIMLKTLKPAETSRAITPEKHELDVFNRTLKSVVLNRNSQGSLDEVRTQRNPNNVEENAPRSRSGRGSVPLLNQNTDSKAIDKYRILLDKVNTSQAKKKRDYNSLFQNVRYQYSSGEEDEEVEEETDSVRYAGLNDSAIHQNVPESVVYHSSNRSNEYSLRRNNGLKNEKRQVQSQNNSFNFAEDDLIFARIIPDQHKSAYCSPNFKENID